MISFKAIDLLKSIPQNLKDLKVHTFSKNIKKFLLSEKYSVISIHLTTLPLLYLNLLQILFLTMLFASSFFLSPRLYQMWHAWVAMENQLGNRMVYLAEIKMHLFYKIPTLLS